MKKVMNKELLKFYTDKYNLADIFKENLLGEMELYAYNKGEHVCSVEEKLELLLFLVEGKVKTYTVNKTGKAFLLCFNAPLSVFGDVELVTKNKILCNVETIDNSLFIGIEIDKLTAVLENSTTFLSFLNHNLAEKLYGISNKTTINLLHSVDVRLSSYILSISRNDEASEVTIPQLTEIANLLGTSYRHLNRTIKDLEEKGIIHKNKKTITVKDSNALKELAQGNIYEN